MKKIIVAFFTFFVIIPWINVDAASMCSYDKFQELSKTAANVKVSYEETSREMNPDEYFHVAEAETDIAPTYEYFKINIFNVTKDIYIKLTNSANSEIKYINYSDTDEGTFSIDWYDLNDIVTFSYTIYTSENTECQNEELKNGVITTPMLNLYYDRPECQENKDFYLCKKFVTVNTDGNLFKQKLDEYISKKNKKPEEKNPTGKIIEKNKNSKILIITLPVLIVVGVVAVIAIDKRRSRKI